MITRLAKWWLTANKPKLLVVRINATCRKYDPEGSRKNKDNGCQFDVITYEVNCHADLGYWETEDVILVGLNINTNITTCNAAN